jgi:hypothetical protein
MLRSYDGFAAVIRGGMRLNGARVGVCAPIRVNLDHRAVGLQDNLPEIIPDSNLLCPATASHVPHLLPLKLRALCPTPHLWQQQSGNVKANLDFLQLRRCELKTA